MVEETVSSNMASFETWQKRYLEPPEGKIENVPI